MSISSSAEPEPQSPQKRVKKSRRRPPKSSSEAESSETHNSSDPSTDTSRPASPTISPSTDNALTTTMPISRVTPVFVASIGNPAPYARTLHSAGHLVLDLIQLSQLNHTQQEPLYPAWTPYNGGQISRPTKSLYTRRSLLTRAYRSETAQAPTLWKSGAMMNVSGPAVKRAWKAWLDKGGFGSDLKPRLVIVHDELEKELGVVTVRVDPKLSAKGHNGIKSIQKAFQNEPFVRIGVGIGRPESRERDAVSNYVLRNATEKELTKLAEAHEEVFRRIEEVHEGSI